MSVICQSELPEDMRVERPLPGVQPLHMQDWLRVDDVYGAQMAERERLMAQVPDLVRAQMPGAGPACAEALELVLQQLRSMDGFERREDMMRCPDRRTVDLRADPLMVLGALIQEDICILQKPSGSEEHILSAAILCFPSHWTLSEKIGRAMGRIHRPVSEYDENIRRRVQRLCDGVKVGRPLWRFNHASAQGALFQPRSEQDPPIETGQVERKYQRAERQSLLRLPQSKAIVFSIHTYVVALSP